MSSRSGTTGDTMPPLRRSERLQKKKASRAAESDNGQQLQRKKKKTKQTTKPAPTKPVPSLQVSRNIQPLPHWLLRLQHFQLLQQRGHSSTSLRSDLMTAGRFIASAITTLTTTTTAATERPTTQHRRLKLLTIQQNLNELISSESNYEMKMSETASWLQRYHALPTLSYEIIENIMSFAPLSALAAFRVSVGDHNPDNMLRIVENEVVRRIKYKKDHPEFKGLVVHLKTENGIYCLQLRAPVRDDINGQQQEPSSDDYDVIDTAVDKYCNFRKEKSEIFSDRFHRKHGFCYGTGTVNGIRTKYLMQPNVTPNARYYMCNGEQGFNDIARRELISNDRVYSCHFMNRGPFDNSILTKVIDWSVTINQNDIDHIYDEDDRIDNSHNVQSSNTHNDITRNYVSRRIKHFNSLSSLNMAISRWSREQETRDDYKAFVRCLAYAVVSKESSNITASGKIEFSSKVDRISASEHYIILNLSAPGSGSGMGKSEREFQRIEVIMTHSRKMQD